MNIYLNNITSPSNLVTLTDVPNILKVDETMVGTYAEFTFSFTPDSFQSTVTGDGQYYVSLLGESITNVMNPSNATNRRFYVGKTNYDTAASFVKALRNCGSIAAQFIIYLDNQMVKLRSRTIGPVWSDYPNYYSTNIPTTYMIGVGMDGSSTSNFINSKVSVDVINNDEDVMDKYVTTLEKNWYGNNVSFDISPVLSTFSKYGETQPYRLDVNLYKSDGTYMELGSVTANTMIGYEANQSDRYLYNNSMMVLVNTNMGQRLYSYTNNIKYSVLLNGGYGGWTTIIKCYDNLGNEIYTGTDTRRNNGRTMMEISREIPITAWTNTDYVDITEGTYTIRWYNIKPLRASDTVQRVYWRNEIGGISFFDFTGKVYETDSIDTDTYEKNVFDFYDTEDYERKMIYTTNYKKNIRLTSHLMPKEGTIPFHSLMKSKRVWTEINNKTYYIIPTAIEINENDTYSGIYSVNFTYEYSDI